MTDKPTNKNRYRFWFAISLMLLAVIFGVLSLGSFSMGQELMDESYPSRAADTLLTFNLIGTVFLILVPARLWLTYRLQPKD